MKDIKTKSDVREALRKEMTESNLKYYEVSKQLVILRQEQDEEKNQATFYEKQII